MKKITVCIVDDNSILRNTLQEVITLSETQCCLGTFGHPDEAIEQIKILKPDVVLMDINLGEKVSGIECVRVLKEYLPQTNFMMCTVYEDDDKIFEALNAGASGYILKKTNPSKLLEAIEELHAGGAPMSSQIARKVVTVFQQQTTLSTPLAAPRNSELDVLSKREQDILEELAKGLAYREIAGKLFISAETVRKHVYNIYEKLHVSNRMEAVNKYYGR